MPITNRYDQFYAYEDDATVICGVCLDSGVAKTLEGKLKGDEAVDPNKYKRVDDDNIEPYQCDNCLHQNPAYDIVYGGDEN